MDWTISEPTIITLRMNHIWLSLVRERSKQRELREDHHHHSKRDVGVRRMKWCVITQTPEQPDAGNLAWDVVYVASPQDPTKVDRLDAYFPQDIAAGLYLALRVPVFTIGEMFPIDDD